MDGVRGELTNYESTESTGSLQEARTKRLVASGTASRVHRVVTCRRRAHLALSRVARSALHARLALSRVTQERSPRQAGTEQGDPGALSTPGWQAYGAMGDAAQCFGWKIDI